MGTPRVDLEGQPERSLRPVEPAGDVQAHHRRGPHVALKNRLDTLPGELNAEIPHRTGDSRRSRSLPSGLQAISQKSCAVLRDLGPSIQWVQSYVTEDKITCVYI